MTKIISSTRGWTFKCTCNITCSLTGSKSPNRRKKKNHKALIISRLFPDPCHLCLITALAARKYAPHASVVPIVLRLFGGR